MNLSHWLRSRQVNRGQSSARKTRRTRKAASGRKLLLELLEDRTVPSTFTVTSTADDGTSGTLRWAINQANADTAATSLINFNIASSCVQTILVGSSSAYAGQPMPALTHSTTIDGYSEPGSKQNDLPNDDDAILCIVLNGGSLPGGYNNNGLTLTAPS
jgi:hypothetical protein